MTPPRFRQVAILGAGLLGGSMGLALQARGLAERIVGYARRQATRDEALRRGCVTNVSDDPADACAGADLIVLAVPVGAVVELLPVIGESASGDAIITDVGSTKASIVDAAEAAIPHPGRFIGAHPMAGGERTGPAHADADLFLGRPTILTPTDRTDPDVLARMDQLWRTFGAHVHHMPPEVHDRVVARISHLPHLLACALIELAERDDALTVASTGLRDVSRPASGDPTMWTDIFRDNGPAMLDLIDEMVAQLEQWRRVIADADGQPDRLQQRLTGAKRIRDQWRLGGNPEQPPDTPDSHESGKDVT